MDFLPITVASLGGRPYELIFINACTAESEI